MNMVKFGNAIIETTNKVEVFVKKLKVEFIKAQEIQEQRAIGWIGTLQLHPDGMYKEIPYFVNNAFTLLHQGLPSILPAIGTFNTTEGGLIIVMNKAFTEEPQWVQEAFMAHEYGHVVNKDDETLLRLGLNDTQEYMKARKAGNLEILKMEYEADKYSFYCGFRMKEALMHLSIKYPCFNTKEIHQRIAKLGEL